MTLEQQKTYITHHAMTTPVKRIATIIGRSGTFVYTEMKRQGITVPQHIKDQFKKQSQFKKGHQPINKGIPQSQWMAPDSIANSANTRFKKGHKPHNTKPNYTISKRKDKNGYKYYHIRLSNNNWTLYHRWVWQKHYGAIPQDGNIQFKDGNSLNCDISNLYLISRTQQSIINKKGGNKIPYSLKKTILLINQLNKSIHEK